MANCLYHLLFGFLVRLFTTPTSQEKANSLIVTKLKKKALAEEARGKNGRIFHTATTSTKNNNSSQAYLLSVTNWPISPHD